MKNSNKFMIAIAAIAIMASVFVACKKEQSKSTIPAAFKINFTPAKTPNELLALKADKSANIIRTVSDFDAVVAAGNTPLSSLSSTDLKSFRESIMTRSGGVVSLKYGMLMDKLTESEFNTVMSYFGVDLPHGYWGYSKDPEIVQALASQPNMKVNDIDQPGYDPGTSFADHKGYYCSTQYPHSCFSCSDCICLSGC